MPFRSPSYCNCLRHMADVLSLSTNRISATTTWQHLYRCYQKHLSYKHGFAQLCLRCDMWIINSTEWGQHCQSHLDRPEALSFDVTYVSSARSLSMLGIALFVSVIPDCLHLSDSINSSINFDGRSICIAIFRLLMMTRPQNARTHNASCLLTQFRIYRIISIIYIRHFGQSIEMTPIGPDA